MKRILCPALDNAALYLVFSFTLIFGSYFANAQTITSTTTGGNWSATTTWVGGVVPGSSNAAIIAGGATVTVDVTTAACASLAINTATAGQTGTLKFNSGSTLNVTGTVTVGGAGTRRASITMTNGGTLVAGALAVGAGATTWTPGTGTVQLSATNTLPATFFTTFNNLSISAGTTTTGGTLTINSNLTIADGATFTAAGFALTVTGTTTIGVSTSGSLIVSSATGAKTFVGLVTLNTGAVWNNTANAAIVLRGGITNNGTFTAGTGVYTFNTNAQTLTGTLAIPSVTVTGVTLTNTNTLTVGTALIGSGGLTQAANAILNIGGTSTITTLTATNSGNTVNYTGAAQTTHSNNYYNLSLSGSGADVLRTGTTAIAGNLALSGTVSTSTVVGLTITGNLSVGDGTTFTAAGFALTVTGTTTIGGGTSGSLVVSSATGAKTFTGLLTLSANATWNNSGNSALTFQGGITNNGTFTAGTGVHTFNTNSQALTGTLSIPSVTVTGITLTNSNTLTVGTALIGTGGLTQSANANLNIGGTSTITTLTATSNNNTVNYTGASQTINGANYYHLTLSGSGTDVLKTGTTSIGGNFTLSGAVSTTTVVGLTITGNLSIGNGTSLTVAGFAFTVTGTTTIGTGSSGNLVITSNTGTKTFTGLIRINSGGTWNNSGNSAVTVQGGITNSGTFTSGTRAYTFNTNNQALNGNPLAISRVTVTGVTLTNNVTLTIATALTGTGGLTEAAGVTLNIGGTSTITTLTATSNGNLVNYNGAAQTIKGTNYYHLTLSGSGTNVLQTGTTAISGNFTINGTVTTTAVAALAIGGNFDLEASNTFSAGTFSHNVAGNFTNNGTFNQGTSTFTFSGTAAQTIGGSSATTFYGLTINNSNGVTLNDGTNSVSKTVTNTLTLSAGYLTTTSGNLIVLNSGATATVANSSGGVPQSNSPYINGPINKVGNQAFIFPVGVLGTGCVPIGISAPSLATDIFQAQYQRSSAKTLGGITSTNLYDVSICDYWILNRTGSSTVSVTGYWNANSPCNGEAPGQFVTDLTTISLAHFNGTSWDNNSVNANSFTTGGTITGGVTWSGVSTFSPFALGNNSAVKDNPLAIKLDYFTAIKSSGYNKLSWKAECSSSSNLFIAQRSYDGTTFSNIDSVKANAPSDCDNPFAFNDYSSQGSKVYYRLEMVDINGKITTSDIVLITDESNAINFIRVVPNPVKSDAVLSVSSIKNDMVELVLLSIDGKELQRVTVQVMSGANSINLNTSVLSKGVYVVKGIFSNGQTNTIKFIKE